MTRYEERRYGVFDRENGRHITPSDPQWVAYDAWVRAGNAPDSEPPPLPPPLSARRREAAAHVNGKRAAALKHLTVGVGSYRFDADASSYANLLGVVLLLQSVGEERTTWRTADNQLVSLTPAQVHELLAAVLQERERVYKLSWRLKDEVIAVSDSPETINIEEGLK